MQEQSYKFALTKILRLCYNKNPPSKGGFGANGHNSKAIHFLLKTCDCSTVKKFKKIFKKVLTVQKAHDKISELRLRRKTDRTLTNEQQCNPENSKE